MSKFFVEPGESFEQGAIDQPLEERDRLQVLIISSRDGVMETIHNLHCRGFAEVGDWSPLLPAPTSGEVMSILRRDRVVGRSTFPPLLQPQTFRSTSKWLRLFYKSSLTPPNSLLIQPYTEEIL